MSVDALRSLGDYLSTTSRHRNGDSELNAAGDHNSGPARLARSICMRQLSQLMLIDFAVDVGRLLRDGKTLQRRTSTSTSTTSMQQPHVANIRLSYGSISAVKGVISTTTSIIKPPRYVFPLITSLSPMTLPLSPTHLNLLLQLPTAVTAVIHSSAPHSIPSYGCISPPRGRLQASVVVPVASPLLSWQKRTPSTRWGEFPALGRSCKATFGEWSFELERILAVFHPRI